MMKLRFGPSTLALVALVTILCGMALGHPGLGLVLSALGPVVMMATTPQQDSDLVRQLIAWGILCGSGGYLKRFVAKTADYTILSPLTAGGGDRSGTIFTNRGAVGTVNFTLPAPALALAGVHYDFVTVAAQIMGVLTATADTLITDNDATADSLSTAARIGVQLRLVCDGTSWIATLASGVPAAAFAQTGTVAT
jgi:hypothetical protein